MKITKYCFIYAGWALLCLLVQIRFCWYGANAWLQPLTFVTSGLLTLPVRMCCRRKILDRIRPLDEEAYQIAIQTDAFNRPDTLVIDKNYSYSYEVTQYLNAWKRITIASLLFMAWTMAVCIYCTV